MSDDRDAVQRAYDNAVNKDGGPTGRMKRYVEGRPGLASEVVSVCMQLVADPEIEQFDALLAMFCAGICYADDDTP